MLNLLTDHQKKEFEENGVLIIKNFYSIEKDILPIQKAIYEIIGLIITKYNLPVSRRPFSSDNFDDGFQHIIALKRAYGSEIYDAVKQIPAFIRLLGHPLHEILFQDLRPQSLPAIAAGGYGIRIDNPNEECFRANWHQEYPAQLRSLDGVVYWSPLVKITPDIGPVEFCLGSQVEGAIPVYTQDHKNPEKKGAYSLTLKNEEQLLTQYPHVSPLTEPSDLVIINFLVLHASGHNKSERSRWSMQFRYFNFKEATGLGHGWKGSYAAGIDFRDIHPELCAD